MAFPLSNAQSDRLREFVSHFTRGTDDLHPEVHLAFRLMYQGMLTGRSMEIEDLLLLKWALDVFFSSVPEKWWDEHLESAYYRLYDAWPKDPPFFVHRDNARWPIGREMT